MKKIILIIISFFSILTIAQKKYPFDYCIELNIHKQTNQEQYKLYFLINSINPNYSGYIRNIDKDTISFSFLDIDGTRVTNALIDSTSFFKAENINFDCKLVNEDLFYSNFKYKEYEINRLSDTILNGELCYHLEVKSKKSINYQKRKKIIKRHYIIEKNINFIPSFVNNELLVYRIYKNSLETIKGKIKLTFDLDTNGKIVSKCSYNYIEINKNVIIPMECDYTLKKNKLRSKFKTQE